MQDLQVANTALATELSATQARSQEELSMLKDEIAGLKTCVMSEKQKAVSSC